MRRCYICDRAILGAGCRRWVPVGTSRYGRVYMSRRGVSGSSTAGTRTAVRTVCENCNAAIIRGHRATKRIAWVALYVALCWAAYHYGSIIWPNPPVVEPSYVTESSPGVSQSHVVFPPPTVGAGHPAGDHR